MFLLLHRSRLPSNAILLGSVGYDAIVVCGEFVNQIVSVDPLEGNIAHVAEQLMSCSHNELWIQSLGLGVGSQVLLVYQGSHVPREFLLSGPMLPLGKVLGLVVLVGPSLWEPQW